MSDKRLIISKLYFLLLFFVFCGGTTAFAQRESLALKFKWLEPSNAYVYGTSVRQLAFEGCDYGSSSPSVPVCSRSVDICCDNVTFKAFLDSIVAVECNADESDLLSDVTGSDFVLTSNIVVSRGNPMLVFSVLPFRKTGSGYEKLISCSISYEIEYPKTLTDSPAPEYSTQSVLSEGQWYKFAVSETGMHKVTYSDLSSAGVDVSGHQNIKFFHNGGGILPEANSESRYDDLVEIPVLYVDADGDGAFGSADYFLLYARGPVVWKYNQTDNFFERINNPYEDNSYLFVTVGGTAGKRIETASYADGQTVGDVTEFLDYALVEDDNINLNRMGRTWYGDVFGTVLTRSYPFSFPNIVSARQHAVRIELAARAFSSSSFNAYVNNVHVRTFSHASANSMLYASTSSATVGFSSSSDNVTVNLQYVQGAASGTGYLDYIALNVWRQLKFAGHQMAFRNPQLVSDSLYKFELSASSTLSLWDVSSPVEPKIVDATLSGGKYSFNALGNSEFVAFDGQDFNNVSFVGQVANQNLHSLRDIDFLIVTHPDFLENAMLLKQLHDEYDDLVTQVVTTDMIYNEFSCGAQDIAAIRDFIRMLYLDSNSGREIKYVLLFGDASYDMKNRNGKANFIGTHQSLFSTHIGSSLCTDDFFGCMDESEGEMGNGDSFQNIPGIPDVGIGRFTVETPTQAAQMVAKVEQYMKAEARMQNWKNVFTFTCDDGEGNQFINHAEVLADMAKTLNPNLVVDKIYLDAMEQVSAPGGQRSPMMNKAINDRMEKGTIYFNYTGHAGEVGFAEERILENADIMSWRNSPRMPLVVTASCEFGRYDDHTRTSSGEYVFLNQYGGAIGLVTAARVTYGAQNFRMNKALMTKLLTVEGGKYLCFGDALRMSKIYGDKNDKSYLLIGDPALRLALPNPNYEVVTEKINGHDVDGSLDTIRALQPVTIDGYVSTSSGIDAGFNGTVYVTVFDKPVSVTTVGDESDSFSFELQNSMVFNGRSEVVDGRFSVTFTVPKDINYSFGKGLISYYATDGTLDAAGNCSSIVVGGFYEGYEPDDDAPEIELYIDDYKFVDGGITSQSPVLLARLRDSHGINTTGAGIGHNITATISGATTASFTLNDYYEAPVSFDDFGTLEYKMSGLNDGEHTLTMKVWDVYNNSSVQTINFVVVNNATPAVSNASNYPNPVEDVTYFVFDHNLVGNEFDVEIQIYDIAGMLVSTLSSHQYGTTVRSNPIVWDCRSTSGAKLGSGLYIYRVYITDENGGSYSSFSKLIVR